MIFNKLILAMCTLTLLVGCSASQDSILGEASTTTEAVLNESAQESSKWNDFKDDELTRYVERKNNTYANSFNVRQGIGELAPRTHYIPNPRRVIYFYPRLTKLGSLEPAYGVEYPTYNHLHVIKPR
jgi:conjugative transfer region lipoprotein (TIGR03751 family)